MWRSLSLTAIVACSFHPGRVATSPDGSSPITCRDLVCDPHATCAMSGSGAMCTCSAGYSGDGMTCVAVDPCATNNGGCPAACVNVGGSASCYAPKTCADVAAKTTLVNDTSVALFVGGDPAKPWTAFCHDGHEYLTLPAGANANYGQYTAGVKSPGTDVRTKYARVRLDPIALKVDICDQTFAVSSGGLFHDPNNVPNIKVTSMPLGSAMDCAGDNSQNGLANIDLTGVPFIVSASWAKGGNNPGGAASKTGGGRVVAISGGGNCGWDAPMGSPSNPFNTFTGSSILGLAYLP